MNSKTNTPNVARTSTPQARQSPMILTNLPIEILYLVMVLGGRIVVDTLKFVSRGMRVVALEVSRKCRFHSVVDAPMRVDFGIDVKQNPSNAAALFTKMFQASGVGGFLADVVAGGYTALAQWCMAYFGTAVRAIHLQYAAQYSQLATLAAIMPANMTPENWTALAMGCGLSENRAMVDFMADMLIKCDVDITHTTFWSTLCSNAVMTGNLKYVTYAIHKGLPFNRYTLAFAATILDSVAALELVFSIMSGDEALAMHSGLFQAAVIRDRVHIFDWFVDRGRDAGSQVINAVGEGKIKILASMLRRGMQVTTLSNISYAAVSSQWDVVKWMHANGAPNTAIACVECAARDGNIAMLEWLVSAGFPMSNAACYHAACAGKMDALRWLITHGAPRENTYMIHELLNRGEIETIRWLWGNGVVRYHNACCLHRIRNVINPQ